MFKNRTLLGNRSKKITLNRKNFISSSNVLKNNLIERKIPEELIDNLVFEAESFPAFYNMDIQLYTQVIMFLLNNINVDLNQLINENNIKKQIQHLIPADKNDSSDFNQELITQRYIVEFFYYMKYVLKQREKNIEIESFVQENLNNK
jgi:hypothetical protein